MTRLPEQKLWDLLRPAIKGVQCRPVRVENMVEEGFPDILVQHAAAGWTFIETKARPIQAKRITSKVLGTGFGLSLAQRNWWKAYTNFGGARGLIVSRVGSLIFAHKANYADELNNMQLEEFCDTASARSVAEICKMCVMHEGYWK